MTPYYEDATSTIYHGDAIEVLGSLKPSSVQAVVTDPPYVIGAVSAGNMASKAGGWADMMNSALWFSTWYRLVDRALHSSGSFWTFCNWRSLPVVMRAASDACLPVTSMLVWDKEWIGPGGSQGLRPAYELVALMGQPDFAIPDRGTNDVWRHKVGSYKEHGHPAQKPEPLVRRILTTCDMPAGSLVVDPFVGSGTTAEERWCETTARRLGQGILEFDEPHDSLSCVRHPECLTIGGVADVQVAGGLL